jgi:hypothetical protein
VIVGGDLEQDSRYTGVEEGDPAAGDHGPQHDLFGLKKHRFQILSFWCGATKWLGRLPVAIAVPVRFSAQHPKVQR